MRRKTGWPVRLIAIAGGAAIVVSGFALRAGRLQAQAQGLPIECNTEQGFAEIDAVAPLGPAFLPLTSLKAVDNPIFPIDPVTGQPVLRDDLRQYIVNPTAAIRLGKALFWDIQASSDNKVSCGTCHVHAGADGRATNQLSPGYNGQFFDNAGTSPFAPNYTLTPGDFPFTDPAGDLSDNVVGSQGVTKSTFVSVSATGVEKVAAVIDPVFTTSGKNVRQVTGIHTPAVLNAVFNHRNFWDGRAQPDFNGVTPFGTRDTTAKIWVLDAVGRPAQMAVKVQNAALASQAVGPPMSDVEMSATGRKFPDLGKKMLLRKPLGLQAVHPSDSVLGPIVDTAVGAKGLNVTYASLIQQAFHPKYWNSALTVKVGGKAYTMMQANFSFFWGLSIMLYESTLVSDDSPMDRYLASRTVDPVTGRLVAGDPEAYFGELVARLRADGFPTLTAQHVVDGLALFERPLSEQTLKGEGVPSTDGDGDGLPDWGAGCTGCHIGAELTAASVRNLVTHGLEPGDLAFRNAGFDPRMERMFMQLPPVHEGTDQISFDPATYRIEATRNKDGGTEHLGPARAAVYDAGWYNVGVRPAIENPGLGGKDPFGKFLSWTKLFQALPYPEMIKVPGGGLGCAATPPGAPATSPFAGEVLNPLTGMPLLAGALHKTDDTAVDGSFKTPSLRNVELTGPYLHTGAKATLRQVIELYDDGGDFRQALGNPDLAPLIMPLGLTEYQIQSLIAFLHALTDDRVRFKRAPFDHPELQVPHGAKVSRTGVVSDVMVAVPAVGAAGAAVPLRRFLNSGPMD